MDGPEIQTLAALLRQVIAAAGQAASFLHRKQKVDDLCLNDVSDAFSNLMVKLNAVLPKPITTEPVKKKRERETKKIVDQTETPTDDRTGTDQPT